MSITVSWIRITRTDTHRVRFLIAVYQSMCNAAGVNVKDEEIKVGGAVRLGLSVAGTVVIAMTFATLL